MKKRKKGVPYHGRLQAGFQLHTIKFNPSTTYVWYRYFNNCPVENLLLIAEACLLGRASHKALDFQNSRFHDLSWWEVYRLSTSQSNITLIYNVHANLRSLRIEAEIINTYIHIYIILYILIYTHLYPSQVLQLQVQDTTSPGPKSKCTMASPQWLGWMDGSVVFTKIPCYIDAKLQPQHVWWLICVILWYLWHTNSNGQRHVSHFHYLLIFFSFCNLKERIPTPPTLSFIPPTSSSISAGCVPAWANQRQSIVWCEDNSSIDKDNTYKKPKKDLYHKSPRN